MSKETAEIIKIIKRISKKYPYLRFAQILHNLDIIRTRYILNESRSEHIDNFHDTDKEILKRIKNSGFYKKVLDT